MNLLKTLKDISGNAQVDGAAKTTGTKVIRIDNVMNNGRLVTAEEKLRAKQPREMKNL